PHRAIHVDAVVLLTDDLALPGPRVGRADDADALRDKDVRLARAERDPQVNDTMLLPVEVPKVHDQPAHPEPVPVGRDRLDGCRAVMAVADPAPKVEVRRGRDTTSDGQRHGGGDQPAGAAAKRGE